MAQTFVNGEKNGIESKDPGICLISKQLTIQKALARYWEGDRLHVFQKLADVVGKSDYGLYILDSKIADIGTWPAPILLNPIAKSKTWVFLLSKLSDASALIYLPERSLFFERKVEALDRMFSLLNRLTNPESQRKIVRAAYLDSGRSFVIHMGNGNAYVLKIDELPEADKSKVIEYRVGLNQNYLKVKQESGNWFEIPWDDVLHHCEPEYEYYKGRQSENLPIDSARRIGERVQQIRQSEGFSVEDLAQRAGLKRPNLSRLEHGKHTPSLETLERVARALNVTVSDIVAIPQASISRASLVQSDIAAVSKTTYMPSPAKIKVVGVGGAGCNAITCMVREQIRGVEFIAMNTDAAHLGITEAPIRIFLGEKLTRGLGAGGDQNVGRRSAEETREEIKKALAGADMVFLAAGMGGGTGTGSIAVVAEMAKEMGALTIAIVTKPFSFEGNRRMNIAEEGISQLLPKVDTLIIVPNDRLLELSDKKTSVDGAFKLSDEILCQAVLTVAEVITVPGLVNLELGDIKYILKNAGPACMSMGRGSGQNRAVNAAKEALASSLLDVRIQRAKGVLFKVAGGNSLTLFEVSEAAKIIGQAVDPQANIIFGVSIDPNMGNEVRLTLIATGFASRDLIHDISKESELTNLMRYM